MLSSAEVMGVSEGEILAGKYRVERVLGQGGMGVVVAAHHLVLDEKVAIKFLLPDALRSAEAVARFEREARAAVKIKSEHVARVADVGRLDTGAPYMVMELLRGCDLGALLEQRGPLPLEDVADYLLQAGEAIAEAHGLGIVHRDLKPPNLFLTERADGSSCVKVLDFGISKLTNPGSSSDQAMTSTTAIMGSPLYMSPEQLMSARDVDMRTDVWSLGVICYELLTGKPPFSADTLPQLCMAISTAPPTPLRNYRPDLPIEVEELLLRCLQKDRSKRIATVAELASELVKFAPRRSRLSAERIERLARAAGFSVSAFALIPSSGMEATAITDPGIRTLTEFGRTGQSASGKPLRWVLLVAGVLAAGGALGFTLLRPAAGAGSTQPSPAESLAQTPTPVPPPPAQEPAPVPVVAMAPLAASGTVVEPAPVSSPVAHVAKPAAVKPGAQSSSRKATAPAEQSKPVVRAAEATAAAALPPAPPQAATPAPRSRL